MLELNGLYNRSRYPLTIPINRLEAFLSLVVDDCRIILSIILADGKIPHLPNHHISNHHLANIMNSSNRASAPAPLDMHHASRTSSSTSDQGSAGYFDSPAFIDDKVHSRTPTPPRINLTRIQQRTGSYSSDVSILDSASSPPKSAHPWIKPAATVNVYTTCGRHTDQLLFGGPSLTELARSMMGKK